MPCDGFTLWPVYPGEMTNSTAPLPLVETPADVDQAHLVRRARRGEREAFEQLYREHAHAVHALAWRITSDREAAEEALRNAKSEIDVARATSELAILAAELAALRKYRERPKH